ncbi:MAG: methyltransferase, TIGR04325 family [Desmonostoc vinosum HA7617-LM4]|jgi:putative methyltransferase (TIGR04325 family)|nr:methyltransferase, TIGR04325 family [Desmonostoc vinosum HA7617-LM4]
MKRIIKSLPFVKKTYQSFQESKYERRFAGECYGCFRGVFNTFEQAIQSAPKTKTIGYDNNDLAQEYQEMLESENWEQSQHLINSYDYPVLFWLNSIFTTNLVNHIFDLGGNVGIHFYAYKKHLNCQEITWTICDLSEIIKVGKKIAEKRQQKDLFFTTSFAEANNKNILLASGSVQYVNHFSQQIEKLLVKPVHILVNRLPIYDGKQFVTLQNGGKVFYPQYVFNRSDFIESFNEIGYELIDIWQDRLGSCMIPFYPENSVPFYHGMYFKLRE